MTVQPSLTVEERLAVIQAIKVLERTHSQRAIASTLVISQAAVTKALKHGEVGADIAKKVREYFRCDSLDKLVARFGVAAAVAAPSIPVPERAADDPFPERAIAVRDAVKRGRSAAAIRFVTLEPEFQLPHLRFKLAHWWSTTIDDFDLIFSRTVPKTDEEMEAFATTQHQQEQRKKRLKSAEPKRVKSPPAPVVSRTKAR